MKLILIAYVCVLIQHGQALETGPLGNRQKNRPAPVETGVGHTIGQHEVSAPSDAVASVELVHDVSPNSKEAPEQSSSKAQPEVGISVLQKSKISLSNHRSASVQSVFADMNALSAANQTLGPMLHSSNHTRVMLADVGHLTHRMGLSKAQQQFFAPLQLSTNGVFEQHHRNTQPKAPARIQKTASKVPRPVPLALVPLAKEVVAAPVPVALMQVASVKTPSKEAPPKAATVQAASKPVAPAKSEAVSVPTTGGVHVASHVAALAPTERAMHAAAHIPALPADVANAVKQEAASPVGGGEVVNSAVAATASVHAATPVAGPVSVGGTHLAEPVASATVDHQIKSARGAEVGGPIRRLFLAVFEHWQKHGVTGSFYGSSQQAVQPSILLGILLVVFILIQLAALAYVAYHAHSSLSTMRAACPNPHQRTGNSRLRELIPGISWRDCVPYETRNSAHLQAQSGNSPRQRRTKENNALHGDEQVFSQMSRQGLSSWTTKQRTQYMAASSDDGGQAANQARLREMLAADRHASDRQAAATTYSRNPTKESLEKLQRSSLGPGFPPQDEAWDSLESTLAVATRRADMNKRILDMLNQVPKQNSLGDMLDQEYDAMVEWDIESNKLQGQSPAKASAKQPFLA